ncbi:SagB/ThcOx family dehydrogenase [Allopusillimonas ginsengisoli]|uniref:SagB/ThcOx family dehydrogenase n=1 Tax=Allopusillimonas ginsengisoli TaxID=453575 RepID=UPI0010C1D84C|nr:SagB/ThcOx family dehydrogenase [Allopusillimonas ginsengisoli]
MNIPFASSPSFHPQTRAESESVTSAAAADLAVLQRLLRQRHSCRDYSALPITLDALRCLADAAQGQVRKVGARTVPSAHAVYPLQLYILARRVQGLEPGFYRYSAAGDEKEHVLTEKTKPDQYDWCQLRALRVSSQEPSLVSASLAEDTWLDTAAALVVIAADRQRAVKHFADQSADGQRGARYVDIEAGAVIQNLYLATTVLGLGGVVVMGFNETHMHRLLQLEGGSDLVALYCVGHPASPE